jgi:hypothetical protein
LDDLLSESEIIFRKGFHTDVEVELTPESGGPSVFLGFTYFLSEPRPVGFRTPLFKGQPSRSVEKRVAAIVSTFERANSIGFLDRNRCVVLCDTTGDERRHYITRLSEFAHVVDASDDSAARSVHDIVYSTKLPRSLSDLAPNPLIPVSIAFLFAKKYHFILMGYVLLTSQVRQAPS